MSTYKVYENQRLLSGSIPKTANRLYFCDGSDQSLEIGVIPNHIVSLYLGDFNHPLKKGAIPDSVKKLDFGWNFNKPLEIGVIPPSVRELNFSWNFNKPLEIGVIPPSVVSLTFRGLFNHPLKIGTIPPSVISLTFGHYFNQPLTPGMIPDGVVSLTFGEYFNQPLGLGMIPPSVESLILDRKFQNDLVNLPNSIKKLTVCETFTGKIKFPLSLEILNIRSEIGLYEICDHPLLKLFKNYKKVISLKEKNDIVKNIINFEYTSFIIRKIILFRD